MDVCLSAQVQLQCYIAVCSALEEGPERNVKGVIGDCKGSMGEDQQGLSLGTVGVHAGRHWLSRSAYY